MYAMMREAFYLVENGYATVEDVDRSVRNDMGYWITMAGPFRYMDLTGIPAYAAVMRDLLPDLCRSQETPKLMQEVVASGARGTSNAKGFYNTRRRRRNVGRSVFSISAMRFAHSRSSMRNGQKTEV